MLKKKLLNIIYFLGWKFNGVFTWKNFCLPWRIKNILLPDYGDNLVHDFYTCEAQAFRSFVLMDVIKRHKPTKMRWEQEVKPTREREKKLLRRWRTSHPEKNKNSSRFLRWVAKEYHFQPRSQNDTERGKQMAK